MSVGGEGQGEMPVGGEGRKRIYTGLGFSLVVKFRRSKTPLPDFQKLDNTKKQSGFRHGDSTTNQLIDLVHRIHKLFDDDNCLEVRSVFLDISKAFDGLLKGIALRTTYQIESKGEKLQ
jgi:hypothetical protein